jgi:hypothetical protein
MTIANNVIGITGTRRGMNDNQRASFTARISQADLKSFHQGCCVGVDFESCQIVRQIHRDSVRIFGHLPENKELLMDPLSVCDFLYPPVSYYKRDRNIVRRVSVLYVIPLSFVPEPRSGTWYTMNFARKLNKPVVIFWPDGTISYT